MQSTDLLVPTYRQMLQSLSQWLDKARAQVPEGEADALLSARLAPDMFPLSTQVRFACVQAYEAIGLLQEGQRPPIVQVLLDEGRGAGEHPGSMAEAVQRIADTIAALDKLEPAALDGEGSRPIAHELGNGMIFDFTADQYARDWTLPQFYFHLMTAYAILRNQGIELGKADYVAHLFEFVRPGTMPAL